MKGLLLNYQYGMWDAVLSGIKTNTRRAHSCLNPVNADPDAWQYIGDRIDEEGNIFARFLPKKGGQIIQCRARYKVGEISFLQEPTMNLRGYVTDDDMIMRKYRDKDGNSEMDAFGQLIQVAEKKGAKWSNKMFMGADLARYHVKIKRIEVERLMDISEADCMAEGIRHNIGGYYFTRNGEKVFFSTPQKAYFGLYKGVNEDDQVNNIWVFSYHFELVHYDGKN